MAKLEKHPNFGLSMYISNSKGPFIVLTGFDYGKLEIESIDIPQTWTHVASIIDFNIDSPVWTNYL